MRKFIPAIIGIIGFVVCMFSCANGNDMTDIAEITALVKSVYKQDTRSFLRIRIEERAENTVKYYEHYFTPEASRIAAKKIAELIEGVAGIMVGPFGNGIDPRYGYDITIGIDETESNWYENIPVRRVEKIKYHKAVINDIYATMYVDSLLKGRNDEYRTIYYLEKTKNGWRISDIKWAPKDCFESSEAELARCLRPTL